MGEEIAALWSPVIQGLASTGMRASVTTPTIATTKHATIIKNGFRIENPDISFHFLFPPLRR